MNYTPKIGHIFGYSSINRALTFLLNRGLTFLLHFCDSILYIRLLQTLIGISESTIDFLLDRPGLIDQLHQLPDQDIPFLVHQFIPLLRKRKRIFRKHQVSFCRKCSWIQSSHLFYSSLLATDPGVALVVTPSSRFV